MIQLIGLAIVGTLLALLVKKYAPEQGYLVALVAVGAIGILFIGPLSEIMTYVTSLATAANLDDRLLMPLFKGVGIGIVIRLTADLCRDAKEQALGTAVEIGGSILILYISMPLFSTVLQLIESML